MQYEIIFSEITGGVPVPEHPGTDKECPALFVRYETKMSRQGTYMTQRHTEKSAW